MFSNRRIRLTTLFSIIVGAAVLLTLLITVAASYKSERETLFDRTLEMNYSSASRMSHTLDILFQSMQGGLISTSKEFADTHLTGELELNQVQEQLNFLKGSSNYFNSVFWANQNGIVIKITPPSITLEGEQLKTEPVKQALDIRKPTLSLPYISTTGKLIVLLTEPVINSQGEYRGFIGGTLYLEESNVLGSIFGLNDVDGTGTFFYIVDSAGKVIYHPDRTKLGKNASNNEVVAKLTTGQSGKKSIISGDGTPYLAAYAAADNGWGVVVQTPISVVDRQQNEQVAGMLWIMLIPFLGIIILTIFLARKVARPFVTLGNYVSDAAQGKATPVLPEGKGWVREARLLTEAVIRYIREMGQQKEELLDTARRDALTGLMNRRSFEEIAASFEESGDPFGLLVLDIDHFKQINDTYGHQCGDEALKLLSRSLEGLIRPVDSCFRYGGEEFVILLPGVSRREAYETAERIRTRIEAEQTPIPARITVSIGIAHCPDQAKKIKELFKHADRALYSSKQQGRNRTTGI